MKTRDMISFRVGTYIFNDDCKLYIIVGFSEGNDAMKDRFEKVLKMVGHIGIGGKMSSGYRKYEINNYEKYKDKHNVYKYARPLFLEVILNAK